MPPKVLFLAEPGEDYVADSLFHGLRTLLGADAVDVPRRDPLYAGADLGRPLYGRGFGLYRLLEDIPVDRERALERAADGEFDLVVSGSIWRDWDWWVRAWRTVGTRARHAVVDGADVQWMYPYGPTWWRSPRRWTLPRAHRRAAYFKRERSRLTGWLRYYGLVPPPLSDHVPILPVAISYPAEKIVDRVGEKTRLFQTHIVDPELADGVTGYAFEDEDAYRADLASARYGITVKRDGWDALRHYEIAAAGTVPAYRQLMRKPPGCAPFGLRPGVNCLAYDDAAHLRAQIDRIPDALYAELAEGALAWARENTTVRSAERFLAAAGV
ncbi:MAG TPA: hypothetical protein VNS09_20040 [Solirubrobacter sp.]|nr:hypothetical protein [Solirubrobacter sp.]